MSTTLIEKHIVKYSSNSVAPSITLFNALGEIGVLMFYPNPSALPEDKQAGELIVLNYHKEDFGNIRQILKTEKPVYLLYSGSEDDSGNGIITGDPEEYQVAEKTVKKKRTK